MLCVLIRIASSRRFKWVHSTYNHCVENRKDFPKLSLFAFWTCAVINPQWLELPMSRTNFYGPEDVRAIEVRLYTYWFHLRQNTIGSVRVTERKRMWIMVPIPFKVVRYRRGWGRGGGGGRGQILWGRSLDDIKKIIKKYLRNGSSKRIYKLILLLLQCLCRMSLLTCFLIKCTIYVCVKDCIQLFCHKRSTISIRALGKESFVSDLLACNNGRKRFDFGKWQTAWIKKRQGLASIIISS